MYREKHVSIPKEIASILLCGILSDTLILQSATTTEIDKETAEYLSDITDLDIKELGNEILLAGSRVGSRNAGEIVRQDMKEYTEGKFVYTVSQIEVGNANEILSRKKEFFDEYLPLRSHGLWGGYIDKEKSIIVVDNNSNDDVRNYLKSLGDSDAFIIAKVESEKGVENLEEIIEVSDVEYDFAKASILSQYIKNDKIVFFISNFISYFISKIFIFKIC